MSSSKKRPARLRRTADEARRLILDAAQKRLTEGGPEGLRLQDIAGDLGIAHSSILHHFGSRDALLAALEERAMDELRRGILALPRASAPDALEHVSRILGDEGHARLLAWQSLSGRRSVDGLGDGLIDTLIDSFHGEREAIAVARGAGAPTREETSFAVHLAAVAMFGDALIGDLLTAGNGAQDAALHRRRFRQWLGELLDREGIREALPAPPAAKVPSQKR